MADFTYNQSTPNGTTLITLTPSGGVGYSYALDINESGTLSALEVDTLGAVKVLDNSQLPATGMNFYGIITEDATCISEDVPIEGGFIATQTQDYFYFRESTCLVSEGGGCTGEDHGDWAAVKVLFTSATILDRVEGGNPQGQVAYGETSGGQNHVIQVALTEVSGGSYTSFEVDVTKATYGPSLSHECRIVVSNTAPTAGDDFKSWATALDLGDPKLGTAGIKTIDVSSIDTTSIFYVAIVPTPWWDETLTDQLYDNNTWYLMETIVS